MNLLLEKLEKKYPNISNNAKIIELYEKIAEAVYNKPDTSNVRDTLDTSNVRDTLDTSNVTKIFVEETQPKTHPPAYAHTSTTAIGQFGEELIYNYLTTAKCYMDAVVKLVCKEEKRGDIIMKWKGCRCILEIKNKKIITKDDTDKFERDILDARDTQYAINCGIFLTLRNAQIAGRTREIIQFDTIAGIPIIYCSVPVAPHTDYANYSTVLREPFEALDVSLAALANYVKNAANGANGGNAARAADNFAAVYSRLFESNEGLKKRATNLGREIKAMAKIINDNEIYLEKYKFELVQSLDADTGTDAVIGISEAKSITADNSESLLTAIGVDLENIYKKFNAGQKTKKYFTDNIVDKKKQSEILIKTGIDIYKYVKNKKI